MLSGTHLKREVKQALGKWEKKISAWFLKTGVLRLHSHNKTSHQSMINMNTLTSQILLFENAHHPVTPDNVDEFLLSLAPWDF